MILIDFYVFRGIKKIGVLWLFMVIEDGFGKCVLIKVFLKGVVGCVGVIGCKVSVIYMIL